MKNFTVVIFIMAALIALLAVADYSKFPYPILLVVVLNELKQKPLANKTNGLKEGM